MPPDRPPPPPSIPPLNCSHTVWERNGAVTPPILPAIRPECPILSSLESLRRAWAIAAAKLIWRRMMDVMNARASVMERVPSVLQWR